MGLTYLNHITLSTGRNARSERSGVDDSVLALLSPWLKKIINSGQAMPLPVDDLSHFSAKAFVQDGGLVVTVYGPSGPHERGTPANADIPLVTFGVAQRSRHGGDLWTMLLANFKQLDGIKQPSAPWCAVVVHPSAFAHRDALDWLADFERCVAWAWITRQPDIKEC